MNSYEQKTFLGQTLLYNPEAHFDFSDYGISIPMAYDRSQKIFEHFKQDSFDLKYVSKHSLIKIKREDLLRVHRVQYVDELLFSDEKLMYHIFNAYELVDIDGNVYRFNADLQKKSWRNFLDQVLMQIELTYMASVVALEMGFSFYLGGGMHHAMTDRGRGFCLLHDVAIAIRKLQNEKKVQRVWVIDLDAHKGDGTAEIFKNDPTVTTMSIHMQEGWPLNVGQFSDPWFIPSDVDCGISADDSQEYYLEQCRKGLERCLELSDNVLPDMAFVVDGADPFEADELESAKLLKLTKETMLKRDEIVYQFFNRRETPMTYVMAGGYGEYSYEIYIQFLELVRKHPTQRTKISPR